jgi:hypothetical protein
MVGPPQAIPWAERWLLSPAARWLALVLGLVCLSSLGGDVALEAATAGQWALCVWASWVEWSAVGAVACIVLAWAGGRPG